MKPLPHDLSRWRHDHHFSAGNPAAEKSTRLVLWITVATMLVEIVAGWWFNSMAVLADGWHMSSHALALGLSAAAYVAARRLSGDGRFAFGTWKIEILGSYSSAILLVLVALFMLYHSVERLLAPTAIHYDQAIAIAVVGLLRGGHGHDHGRDHGHGHHHHHHGDHAAPKDLNLRAAYLHVVADAATSALAIVALFGGKLWGAAWLDPVMGIVGAGLVAAWAVGLLRDAGRVLLDAEMDTPVVQEIRAAIAAGPVRAELCDLHVWRVGADQYACIVSLATAEAAGPDDFKRLLRVHEELVHISVEVNRVPAAA
jgi:cation diffusion facilitator family transporter